eukprot:3661348-Rhodomonas_salina.1
MRGGAGGSSARNFPATSEESEARVESVRGGWRGAGKAQDLIDEDGEERVSSGSFGLVQVEEDEEGEEALRQRDRAVLNQQTVVLKLAHSFLPSPSQLLSSLCEIRNTNMCRLRGSQQSMPSTKNPAVSRERVERWIAGGRRRWTQKIGGERSDQRAVATRKWSALAKVLWKSAPTASIDLDESDKRLARGREDENI